MEIMRGETKLNGKTRARSPFCEAAFNLTANITSTFNLRHPMATTEVVIVFSRDAVHTSRHVEPHAFRVKLMPPF